MKETLPKKAVLVLEDGTVFEGLAAGKIGTTAGEICFNTGMTGYQEVFTDPSYFGQVMVTTNAHIGNYGTSENDTESNKMQIAGLVCKNFTNKFSREMADAAIQEYFENHNMVVIHQLDTRAIVKHIRDKGAMNCIISSEELDVNKLKKELKEVPSMAGLELASKVSTDSAYEFGPEDASIKIAALDFGIKQNILRCFADRGCKVKVFPAKTSFEELRLYNADGYFLSNGPGDPSAMDYAVQTIKKILEANAPVFGICLGHQLLALANDVETYKMHNGHRGINHPVKNLISGKSEITSQNHGFGVKADDIRRKSDEIQITHVNLNDETIEGIKLVNKPAMSVQYHPESSPGPHDSRYLFDEFIQLIKAHKMELVN